VIREERKEREGKEEKRGVKEPIVYLFLDSGKKGEKRLPR